MLLNKESSVQHDNDSYCFEYHTCIDCEHKRSLFGEEPCNICMGIHQKHDRQCKWKPEGE